MADESVFTEAEAQHLVALEAVDILSVYPGKHSGILPALAISNIAQAAGIVCSMGSNLEPSAPWRPRSPRARASA